MFPNRRTRRARCSAWDKILRGMWRPSRYTLSSVALALTGCFNSPNVISVSPDGGTIVVPMNHEGVTARLDQPSKLIVIDTKTGKKHELAQAPASVYWIAAAGDTVVYCGVKNNLNDPVLGILRKKADPVFVEKGMFPTVSDDGRYVIYCVESEKDSPLGGLMRFDTKTGETLALRVDGVMPDISPDGKRVLYVTQDGDDWYAGVMSIDGGGPKNVVAVDPQKAEYVFPRWVDDESFVYRTHSGIAGDDSELFITTLDGQRERITDNVVKDVFPQPIGRDRVVYLSHPNDQKLSDGTNLSTAAVWISEKRDGRWHDRSLGFDAYSFRVVGDDILYLVPHGNTCDLFRAPLNNPKQAVNLTEQIRAQFKDLPEVVKQ